MFVLSLKVCNIDQGHLFACFNIFIEFGGLDCSIQAMKALANCSHLAVLIIILDC